MSGVKIAVAEALGPMLDSFHPFCGRSLRHVWKLVAEGCVSRITFEFENASLVVAADPEDDTVELSVAKILPRVEKANYINASSSPPWAHVVGAPFGWGWVTINQQGYCDGVLLSFGGIVPHVMLNVVASSIKESVVTSTTPL